MMDSENQKKKKIRLSADHSSNILNAFSQTVVLKEKYNNKIRHSWQIIIMY